MEPRGQPDLDVSVSYVQVLSAQRNQLLTAFTTEEHAKTRYEEIAAQLNQRMKELTLFELEAVIKDRKLKELKDALEKERRELEMKTQMTTEMEKRIEAQEALISQLEMQVRSTGTVRSLLEEDESKQLKAYRIKESPSALQSSARSTATGTLPRSSDGLASSWNSKALDSIGPAVESKERLTFLEKKLQLLEDASETQSNLTSLLLSHLSSLTKPKRNPSLNTSKRSKPRSKAKRCIYCHSLLSTSKKVAPYIRNCAGCRAKS